jgi:hypothetical protein
MTGIRGFESPSVAWLQPALMQQVSTKFPEVDSMKYM